MRRLLSGLLAALLILSLLTGCVVSRSGESSGEPPRNRKEKADFTTDEQGRPSYPGAVLGVDVSALQGEIDWTRVRADGVEFAILRIGYRGYTEGGLFVDERFAENYVAARKAGLQVGVYFYSQAISEAEALEEAAFVLKLLDGVPLELPVYFDWESNSNFTERRTTGHESDAVGGWALAFCRAVEDGGYPAGVYFNQRYGYSIMHLEALTDYSFWIAEYQSWQSFSYATDLWQFTGEGRVDGVSTIVDMNLMYAPEENDEEAAEIAR